MKETCRKCGTSIAWVAGGWVATHLGDGCGDCPSGGDHVQKRVGLVLLVVQDAARDSTCELGRPLYWRPNRSRYTHDLAEAGLYEPTESVASEHSRKVDAVPVLEAEIRALEARRTILLGLLSLARGDPA